MPNTITDPVQPTPSFPHYYTEQLNRRERRLDLDWVGVNLPSETKAKRFDFDYSRGHERMPHKFGNLAQSSLAAPRELELQQASQRDPYNFPPPPTQHQVDFPNFRKKMRLRTHSRKRPYFKIYNTINTNRPCLITTVVQTTGKAQMFGQDCSVTLKWLSKNIRSGRTARRLKGTVPARRGPTDTHSLSVCLPGIIMNVIHSWVQFPVVRAHLPLPQPPLPYRNGIKS
ncbi:hypothetical protein J6590_055322 [Homalodisca vitripennis]|nr:hypothetical protein J6590_055322 [Homalodisca vitripennis]